MSASIVAQTVSTASPQIVAMLTQQDSGAVSSTQSNSLTATGGTGPTPRPTQKNTLIARSQVVLQGGFALPVPMSTTQAGALLAISGRATSTDTNYLIAGVIQVHGGARPSQQQSATPAGMISWPLPSAARSQATSSLTPTASMYHPLIMLASTLYMAYARNSGTLVAGGTSGQVPAVFRAHSRAFFFTSEGQGLTAIATTQGDSVIGSGEQNVAFRLDFNPWLQSGEVISTCSATVQAALRTAPTQDISANAAIMLQGAPATNWGVVTVLLGNSNALIEAVYKVTIHIITSRGRTYQESLPPIYCDE